MTIERERFQKYLDAGGCITDVTPWRIEATNGDLPSFYEPAGGLTENDILLGKDDEDRQNIAQEIVYKLLFKRGYYNATSHLAYRDLAPSFQTLGAEHGFDFVADLLERRIAVNKPRAVSPAIINHAPDGEVCNRFELVGNVWHLQFGTEGTEIKDDLAGLRIIARLLGKLHTPISALQLEGHDEKAIPQHQTDAPILDRVAIDDLKRELAETIAAMKEVEEFKDQTEYRQHKQTKIAIEAQLKAAVGLGGKDRFLSQGNERKKSADRVRKALAGVYERLSEATFNMPRLVEHLKRFIKKEGGHFAYRPYSPEPHWAISFK